MYALTCRHRQLPETKARRLSLAIPLPTTLLGASDGYGSANRAARWTLSIHGGWESWQHPGITPDEVRERATRMAVELRQDLATRHSGGRSQDARTSA